MLEEALLGAGGYRNAYKGVLYLQNQQPQSVVVKEFSQTGIECLQQNLDGELLDIGAEMKIVIQTKCYQYVKCVLIVHNIFWCIIICG